MNKEMVSALKEADSTPVILNGIEQQFTITTLDVAKMMEVEHSKLLRKIDGINESLVKAKIGFYKYWKETTYTNKSNNKSCRCFDVTKLGCEFLANKMTGDKGNIFTAKYVERFDKMESVLKRTLESNYKILFDSFNELKASITKKIEQLEEQAKFNHRPSHATKLNWNRIIKTYSKCNADEENIKDLVFARFGISKWEDLHSDKFSEVFAYIREIAEKANLITQIDFFDRDVC